MSESNINNWYLLFKSYHQVNHLSINRVEAQALKEVACGKQTAFFGSCFTRYFFGG